MAKRIFYKKKLREIPFCVLLADHMVISSTGRVYEKWTTNPILALHLMLDLSECDQERICDLDFISSFLNTLPHKIGMTEITQPYVFPYTGKIPDDKGITGFVVIAEGHLSIHAFVDKGYSFVDLFSCKPFDTDMARDLIVGAFASLKPEVCMVESGTGFPRDIYGAQVTA
ncbi:MAG: S-adenosylmethionine decarboxylase [Deltaproteobacteria bacterium]|nr:S-adenosylmethionine decarboxylase [Deltaproteobacteria bacterium]